MDALAARHDAAVQMIDTSVVRVHQHGACIALRWEGCPGSLAARQAGRPSGTAFALVDTFRTRRTVVPKLPLSAQRNQSNQP